MNKIRRKVTSVIALPVAHVIRLSCGHEIGAYDCDWLTDEDVKELGDEPVCYDCTREQDEIERAEKALAELKSKANRRE